jgi:hypothetical protein
MRRRANLTLAAAVTFFALAGASSASASSGIRISLLGQSHTPLAGSPWAYYIRAWGTDGRPFQGAILLEVVTPKGKRIDGIGQFAFTGTWLRAYIWRRPDKGQTLDLRVSLVSGTKVVAKTTYRVNVQ